MAIAFTTSRSVAMCVAVDPSAWGEFEIDQRRHERLNKNLLSYPASILSCTINKQFKDLSSNDKSLFKSNAQAVDGTTEHEAYKRKGNKHFFPASASWSYLTEEPQEASRPKSHLRE